MATGAPPFGYGNAVGTEARFGVDMVDYTNQMFVEAGDRPSDLVRYFRVLFRDLKHDQVFFYSKLLVVKTAERLGHNGADEVSFSSRCRARYAP
jgi:hypothetical protein